MARAGPWRRVSAVRVVRRISHPLSQRLEHRYVDSRALSGPLPAEQRGQNPGIRIHAGRDIGDGNADLARLLLGARDGHHARLALNQQIVGFLVPIRPRVAVAGDIADDERRIGLPQSVRSERQPCRGAGRKVLDEYVGARQQPRQDLFRLRLLEIQRQRLLRAVQPDEMTRHALDRCVVRTGEVSSARALDLDHTRAEVSQVSAWQAAPQRPARVRRRSLLPAAASI